MPSSFSHAVAGIAIGSPLFSVKVPRRYWIFAALCATIPDLDYLWSYGGLPPEHWLAHRGLTHSLIFAAFLAGLVALAVLSREGASPSRRSLWAGLALATATHGLLDSLSTYGAGVAFFLPLTARRYFSPWRPISAGPGPHDHGVLAGLLETIGNELLWIWVPALLLLAVTSRRRWARRA